MQENLKSSLEQVELSEVFYSACGLLAISDYFVDAKWKNYAGLKARVEAKNKTITARVSVGFQTASREVMLGLALYLLSSAFKKNIGENQFLRAYKEFTSRQSTNKLSNALRKIHGRQKDQENSIGKVHDLARFKEELLFEYQDVLTDVNVERIGWSKEKSFRRLGFFDEAFDRIVITKAFDSLKVPNYVVKYVVYHELLHKKHGTLFQRGKSLRRSVHPHAFLQDEKKFVQSNEAENWIKTHSLRLI